MIVLFLVSSFFIFLTSADYEHIKEMRFKFWLNPSVEECYHQLVEKGSSIYFMYEILNAGTDDDTIVVYFRNANNGTVLVTSQSAYRSHLEFSADETVLIDICLDNSRMFTYVKYISVYFHVYYVEKIVAKLKVIEEFGNSSVSSHNSLNLITKNIIIAREIQIEFSLINQHDLFILEENFSWINRWAMIHILICFVCFLFQILFIKRLFKTSRK